MSRGLGHVQRAITRLFADNPDTAFTITDLARAVYSRDLIEDRHRVAVGQAVKRVAQQLWWGAIWHKKSLVYFNKLSLQSYRTACRAGWSLHAFDPGETGWQAAARQAEADYKSSARFRDHCDRSIAAWQAEHDGRLEESEAIWAALRQERQAPIAALVRMAGV
jgi:hypothetical protein